jgi:hypothetical protein
MVKQRQPPRWALDQLEKVKANLINRSVWCPAPTEETIFSKALARVEQKAKGASFQAFLFWTNRRQQLFESGIQSLWITTGLTASYVSDDDEKSFADKIRKVLDHYALDYEWSGRVIHNIEIKGVHLERLRR